MPLDAEPVVGGNVHVKPGSWFAYVLPPDMFEAARRTLVPMHLSHYVTCQRSGRPTECEAQ